MTPAPVWQVAGASVRGAAHRRDGRPNQDAIGWTPADGAGHRIVAAVSDGHGSAPHFRSDRGAALAVDRALEVLAWYADEGADDPAMLPGDLVAAWRGGVAADMASDPIDAPNTTHSPSYAPYGATLIALAANATRLTLLQIGDGDLLLINSHGTVTRPLADDAGLTGEQTYSLCLDDAERHFRTVTLARRDGGWPMAALLASDGVSKSFRDEAAFADAVRQLALRARADLAAFATDLPDWLTQLSFHGSGDDASLCLALAGAQPINQGDDR